MPAKTVLPIFLFVMVAVPCHFAEAQMPEVPGRPFRGIFGGGPRPDPARSRHELTATATVQAAHDDNLTETGGLVGPVSRQQPGYMGMGNGELRHWFGRDARSIATTGRGYVTENSATRRAGIGGDLQIEGTTALGRTNRVSADARASYSPFFTIGAFDSLSDDMDHELLPDANPLTGIEGQHSWQSSGSMTFGRRWGRRDNTDVSYGYSKRDYRGPWGFDTERQELTAAYTRAFGETLKLMPSYRRSDEHLAQADQADRRIHQDSVELGVTYQKRPSRNRGLSLAGSAGATRTQELGPSRSGGAWIPTGNGSVGLGVGRSWAVDIDYRRALATLDAIALRPLTTDAAFLRLSGFVGRRLGLLLSSGFSAGHQAINESSGSGRYDSRSISAEARYTIARSVGVNVNYAYYEHRMRGFQDLHPGIPAELTRKVVSVGMWFRLPLYGTWGATQRPASRRS